MKFCKWGREESLRAEVLFYKGFKRSAEFQILTTKTSFTEFFLTLKCLSWFPRFLFFICYGTPQPAYFVGQLRVHYCTICDLTFLILRNMRWCQKGVGIRPSRVRDAMVWNRGGRVRLWVKQSGRESVSPQAEPVWG